MLSQATGVSRWACPIVFVVSAAAPDITPTRPVHLRDHLVLVEAGDAITAGPDSIRWLPRLFRNR